MLQEENEAVEGSQPGQEESAQQAVAREQLRESQEDRA
jgi:hypothetical protein